MNRKCWNQQHNMSDDSIHLCCFGSEALGNSISQCGSLKINRRLVRFIIQCFQKGLMLDLMWPELFCHAWLSRMFLLSVLYVARHLSLAFPVCPAYCCGHNSSLGKGESFEGLQTWLTSPSPNSFTVSNYFVCVFFFFSGRIYQVTDELGSNLWLIN